MSVAFAAALVLSALAVAPPSIVREGAGERRTKITAMELAPFPAESWALLSDWQGGTAPTGATLSGNVVLICTYSDWYPSAARTWTTVQKLADKYGKQGLVVVGVHNPEGWADAKKPAAPADASKSAPRLLAAHDAKGDFRKAILADQDPDIYIIDRAGQLRYGDIATESAEAAVEELLAESSEKASGVKASIAEAAAKADAEARRSAAIRQEVSLKTIPELTFPEPSAEAYEKATWPKVIKDPNRSNQQGNEPKTLNIPASGQYFPSDPKLKGRCIVVYAWSPELRTTYEKILPAMDRLQVEKGRDIAVIGAVIPVVDQNRNDRPAEDDATIAKKIMSFVQARSISHPQFVSTGDIFGNSNNFTQDNALPYAAVASSNGIIRWEGSPNNPGFRAAIEQVLAADPGVKARREAEASYLKAQTK